MLDICNNAGAAVASEFDGGGDFGEHGARFEIAVFNEFLDVGGGDFVQRLLMRETIINIDIWYCSNGHENIGMNQLGEFFGGVILINDSIDTF